MGEGRKPHNCGQAADLIDLTAYFLLEGAKLCLKASLSSSSKSVEIMILAPRNLFLSYAFLLLSLAVWMDEGTPHERAGRISSGTPSR